MIPLFGVEMFLFLFFSACYCLYSSAIWQINWGRLMSQYLDPYINNIHLAFNNYNNFLFLSWKSCPSRTLRISILKITEAPDSLSLLSPRLVERGPMVTRTNPGALQTRRTKKTEAQITSSACLLEPQARSNESAHTHTRSYFVALRKSMLTGKH